MVKYWHFNCGREENLSHMYPRNMAYIGIADSNLQYEERMKKMELLLSKLLTSRIKQI